MNAGSVGSSRRARRGAALWDALCRLSSDLGSLLKRSLLGRFMGGYRRAERRFCGGRCSRDRGRCRPLSPSRARLVRALSSSRLVAGIRALFRALFRCPLMFYGLFGLAYGIFGMILYFIAPLVSVVRFEPSYLLFSAVAAILSFPMAFSAKSLANALGSGPLSRLLFARFLGIPQERLASPPRRVPTFLPYAAVVLAACASALTYRIHPAVIPLCLLSVGAVGLIFSYPEAGVVLSCAMLPAIWMHIGAMPVLCGLILMTWCSYILKVLFLHRTIRFGLLDAAVLLFGAVVLLSGCIGPATTRESAVRAAVLCLLLSDYFLISNLMTTRAFLRRCLFGAALSVVVVTLLSYIRLIPADSLSWLSGTRAADVLSLGFGRLLSQLSDLWVEDTGLFLVLAVPALCAFLAHNRRLLHGAFGVLFLALDACLILRARSLSALLCAAAAAALFAVLYSPKCLAAGLCLLPAAGCGVLLLRDRLPVSEWARTHLSLSRLYRAQFRESVLTMARDHPAGVGPGREAFAAVYPAYAAPDLGGLTGCRDMYEEILLAFGAAGLAILLTVFLLFMQKSMTCLRSATDRRDRDVILAGVAGAAGILLFGTVRSFLTDPRLLFTVWTALSLCSAHANIVFDETDALTARRAGEPDREDRVFGLGE